jgi:hypothetical protein
MARPFRTWPNSKPDSSVIPFVQFDVDHSIPLVAPTKPARQSLATWEHGCCPKALRLYMNMYEYNQSHVCCVCVCVTPQYRGYVRWVADVCGDVFSLRILCETGFCQCFLPVSPNNGISWLEPWPTGVRTCLPPTQAKKRNARKMTKFVAICLSKVV